MAMHGYMSDGDPLCHSVALSLTLLLKLSWSTVLPWSFSSFSLSVPNFFQCLHICVWEDICIPSILLRHFCHWISGNVKPTPSGSHWQPIVCTHWLSKASVISFFLRISRCFEYPNIEDLYVARSVLDSQFTMRKEEWENDGKENDKKILWVDFRKLSHL